MGFTTRNVVHAQDFRDISSTKQAKLGTVAETEFGKKYRYTLAGGVTLAPGKMNVAAAHVANHVNRTVAGTVAAGATQVSLNLGATAVTANYYTDGEFNVMDATGEGISYSVASHTANAGSAALTVNLNDQIKVGLTVSVSEASLLANPWANAIVATAAVAQRAIGVANVSITTLYYGWLQTTGDCAVLSDGVIAKGATGILSDAVAGALETRVDATLVHGLGIAPEATVDTEYRIINLTVE